MEFFIPRPEPVFCLDSGTIVEREKKTFFIKCWLIGPYCNEFAM